MPEANTIDYAQVYYNFQNNYKIAQMSAEEVGAVVVQMAGFFIRYNLVFADTLKRFSAVKATILNQIDTQTGKAMSSAKADTIADATPEAADYEMARVHINNIQECINALKSLQRSLQQEYSNS